MANVLKIKMTADELSSALMNIAARRLSVCVLDSCGVGHLGSHLMIAGFEPISVRTFAGGDPQETLAAIDRELAKPESAVFITLSYEFGAKLNNFQTKPTTEPDLFLAAFDTLVVHDYTSGETILTGNADKFAEHAALLAEAAKTAVDKPLESGNASLSINFSREEYLAAVENILEEIRSGQTYQTNLTMQFAATFSEEVDPALIFARLRLDNPAPFAAFINRGDSTVVSASPERFIRISGSRIETSPIKGTRPRGKNTRADEAAKTELTTSEKDRAENVMIVDLLRNDIGRVCEFGSVRVEKLCELEEHPTLFHLVSTVAGELRPGTKPSEILRAVFPCGSITGAPKISTMRIIERLEADARGLSMGAIGYCVNGNAFALENVIDLNVAIRTMTVSGDRAVFNAGGGIVIDSDPETEYNEALLKAKALLAALSVPYL